MKLLSLTVMVVNLLACTVAACADEPLAIADGARMLVVGNGFVENDQNHAYFEARLQRRLGGKNVTFRYMGWSGDTVRGSARTAGFQVPQGLARLEKEAKAERPTVVFLAYGMNESFEGPKGLTDFLKDYDKLLKALKPLNARLVILGPTYHENLGPPFPDPAEHNLHLAQFTTALKTFADERRLTFVDLFHPLKAAKNTKLSTNGFLLTDAGYAIAGKAAEEAIGYACHRWEVSLDYSGKVDASVGTKVAVIRAKGDVIRFETTDHMLPVAADFVRLQIKQLPPGEYTLKLDGKLVTSASEIAWQNGISLDKGPMFADGEKLREAIVLRNQLFYRRWRPYNDHSRHWGFIGGDYKLYDQDIAKQEQNIAELRNVRVRAFEITRKEP
jgi:lysophospholipase L1-like esterase